MSLIKADFSSNPSGIFVCNKNIKWLTCLPRAEDNRFLWMVKILNTSFLGGGGVMASVLDLRQEKETHEA
jgi:hypothetical protein